MEKKFILVGIHNRRLAFDFMNSVMRSLDNESIAITHIDLINLRFETEHTEVRYVCCTDRTDKLLGIPHADAIFGIAYEALLARAKPNALIAEREHVGLVDYICKIEREAKPLVFTELQKHMVCAVLSMHIRDKHIPAAIQRAYDHNRDQVRLEIQHLHKPDTAIHIIWDEVTDICECLRAVKNKLDEWVIDKSVWIMTNNPYHNDAWKNLRDSMRGGYTYAKPEFRVEHVCDKDIREMYPKTMIMAGRCNGKSQAFAEYVDKTIFEIMNRKEKENMTMKVMVDTLTSMGFEVEKRYDPICKGYWFTITKGECYTKALFEYPSDTSREYCDARQREFIDYIVNKWHKDFFGKEKTDIPASLKKIALNSVYGKLTREIGYTTQMNIHAALMKGENNMPTRNYCANNFFNTLLAAHRQMLGKPSVPGIKNVYFNEPVTVVIWEDGTKTVVRCNNDQYDPEKGLAMAIAKKALGTNKSGSNYYDIFKKWLPKTEEEPVEETEETNVEEQK